MTSVSIRALLSVLAAFTGEFVRPLSPPQSVFAVREEIPWLAASCTIAQNASRVDASLPSVTQATD
ncbi:hypothetical protein GCM10027061_17130 [Nesterenkonia suensis]